MAKQNRQDDAYNLRRVFEEMELDLVRSLRRNLKRHEQEEKKEGFRWEMWQRAKLRNLQKYRKESKKTVDKISPEVERVVNEALEGNYQRGQNLFNRILDSIKSIFFKRKRVKLPKSIEIHKPSTPPPDEQDFFGVNKNKINVMQEEAEKVSPQEEIPAVEKPEDLPTQEKESKLDNSPADKQEPEEIGGTFHPDGKEKALPEGSNDIKLDDMKKKVVHDLKEAQKAVWRRMDDIYRQTVYRAGMNMAAGVKTLDQAIDMATKEFLDAGIDCIEYKNGRRVNIASYAEMALRTASHRAMLLGEGKKRDEWGIHTVVVSAHANTCPLCAPWQGKVLVDDVFSHVSAREAKELGYPLLSDAMEAGLLHPNCRHTISTYFPGITQLPEVTDTNKALNTYRAEQKQREFERKIRKWKRKEEGSCDPVNISQARKKVKQYRDELEEHMDRHPELRRDYDREKNR
ncbi:phage minor capsid protein [Muricomes sp. OA1]|uniref:phage minor capsid protein n=1 Tax=Muricomes sp. OA1 TaxID=2914165 RepID=UPI001F052710|nr:phage minor capsid protein [Muricomes sp. OA1]MCH1974707.1 phage minor capsid protein [Muricomes sp. OA1]